MRRDAARKLLASDDPAVVDLAKHYLTITEGIELLKLIVKEFMAQKLDAESTAIRLRMVVKAKELAAKASIPMDVAFGIQQIIGGCPIAAINLAHVLDCPACGLLGIALAVSVPPKDGIS